MVMSIAPERLLATGRVRKPVSEHDHSGARAEHGHSRGDPHAQRTDQAEEFGQLPDRGGFAAGDDQPGRLVQVGRGAHRHRSGACPFQGAQVLGHIPLECQHPNPERLGGRHGGTAYQPRPA